MDRVYPCIEVMQNSVGHIGQHDVKVQCLPFEDQQGTQRLSKLTGSCEDMCIVQTATLLFWPSVEQTARSTVRQ